MIAKTAIIYPNVVFGKDVVVEDFCIIGAPCKGCQNEPTIIGNGAIIRSHTVIYAGNKIGANFQTGNKVNIRELNVIGDNVSVGTLSVVEHHVCIEEGVRLHSQVFVPEYCRLGKDVWLGPNVVLTNAKFPKSPNTKQELKGVILEEKVKIGANTTVLPGVRIGYNTLVGAGSVVTKDLPEQIIAAGNPARILRKIHY